MPKAAAPADGVAWITGASSGIGRCVALELARRGWTVAATSRNAEALAALAAEAPAGGGRIHSFPCDVGDGEGLVATVRDIEKRIGPLALVFANAGIAPYMRADRLDIGAFRKTYDVNVLGVVSTIAAALPGMISRQRGQVVANASIAGWRGLPRAAAYASSKAAVINLMECLKFDLDAANVLAQVVSPGFVRTPLTDRNDFPMPFAIPAAMAAVRICDGMAKGRFEITFPRRFAMIMKVVSALPPAFYFPLVTRMTGGRRRR